MPLSGVSGCGTYLEFLGNISAQKANCILGCRKSVPIRVREVTLFLHSDFWRPHLGYCIQLWAPEHNKGMDLLEGVQRRATKMNKGLEELYYKDSMKGEQQ